MSLLGTLGNVKETIQENYTSEKLFKAADACLYDGLDLVIEHTTLVEECLATYTATYTRKQIFNTPDTERVERMVFRFFFADIEGKKALIRRMKLNRDLLLLPVRLFADSCTPYCSGVVSGSPALFDMKRSLYVRDQQADLVRPLLQVKHLHDTYLAMREAIIEKYYRLMVSNVGKLAPAVRGKVDLEDVATEFYAATLTAFAKFDIMSGPFTSYLKGWFKNARTRVFSDEVGVAFLIPPNIRHRVANGYDGINNFSVALENFEEVGVTSKVDLDQESDDAAIRMIVDMFDHSGLYRLINEMEVTPA